MLLGCLIQNGKPVTTEAAVKALGFERRTIQAAFTALKEAGLIIGNRKGYTLAEIPDDKRDWFVWDDKTGKIRTHRVGILAPEHKRTARNIAKLSDLDNSVLWILYSIAKAYKGGVECRNTTAAGLAVLLGSDRDRVGDSLKLLQSKEVKLIAQISGGFALLKPSEEARTWWRSSVVKEKTKELLNLHALSREAHPRWAAADQVALGRLLVPASDTLCSAKLSLDEVEDFWRKFLPLIPDATQGILFFTGGGFTDLVKNARAVHAKGGRHRSCYFLLLKKALAYPFKPTEPPVVEEPEDDFDISLEDELC